MCHNCGDIVFTMKVTKLGHSCVLVEVDEGRLLVDPGNLSIAQHQDLRDIDLILYTHEHGDHLHIDSLQILLVHNPEAVIVCNQGVGAQLAAADIAYQVLAGQDEAVVAGILLRAHDCAHAEIFEDFGQVPHTGYLVAGRLYLPGDSYQVPDWPVEILAPAIVAPFAPIRDVTRFIQAVQPQTVLTMHDGQLNEHGLNTWYGLLERLLVDEVVEFVRFPTGREWCG